MRRPPILAPLAGLAVGLLTFAFGVQGWRPILIGLVVACFTFWARTSWPEGVYLQWPVRGTRVYGGGSHQVARLASSISHRKRSRMPDPGLQHRLRRLAAARLHRLGVPWDDARAAEMVGEDVYAALTRQDFDPDVRGVETIITAIERLDDSGQLAGGLRSSSDASSSERPWTTSSSSGPPGRPTGAA